MSCERCDLPRHRGNVSRYALVVNRAVLGLGLLATMAVETSASAICGQLPEVTVLPHRGIDAPLDTHVWLELRSDWRTTGIGCDTEHPSDACIHADNVFQLRTAPSPGGRPQVVTVDRKEITSGAFTFIELVPRDALAPKTHYEVWSVDRKRKAESRVVGAFTTGTAVDDRAPEWLGITSVSMLPPVPAGTIYLAAECGDPRLSFEIAVPSDEQTPKSAMRAALWIVPAASKIDYDAAPTVLEPIDFFASKTGATILAGSTEEYFDDLPSVDGKTPLRIGIRILDLAGNASPPSEIIAR